MVLKLNIHSIYCLHKDLEATIHICKTENIYLEDSFEITINSPIKVN